MTRRVRRRWRWTVAKLLDHHPRACWTNLVCWVTYTRPLFDRRNGVTFLQDATCRADAAGTGSCYCHRLRDGRVRRRSAA